MKLFAKSISCGIFKEINNPPVSGVSVLPHHGGVFANLAKHALSIEGMQVQVRNESSMRLLIERRCSMAWTIMVCWLNGLNGSLVQHIKSRCNPKYSLLRSNQFPIPEFLLQSLIPPNPNS